MNEKDRLEVIAVTLTPDELRTMFPELTDEQHRGFLACDMLKHALRVLQKLGLDIDPVRVYEPLIAMWIHHVKALSVKADAGSSFVRDAESAAKAMGFESFDEWRKNVRSTRVGCDIDYGRGAISLMVSIPHDDHKHTAGVTMEFPFEATDITHAWEILEEQRTEMMTRWSSGTEGLSHDA